MEILARCVILRPAQCAVLLLNEVIKRHCSDIFIDVKSTQNKLAYGSIINVLPSQILNRSAGR